jgi:hypothetical protein
MGLKPLPQAILTAAKLRQQAKTLLLLADELEGSVDYVPEKSSGEFLFGTVKPRKKTPARRERKP